MKNRQKETLFLGLVGWPLEHSLSPLIHNAALQASGLAGAYNLYPVPPFPEGKNSLQDLLLKMKSSEIHGLNVTIPHKQNVLPFLDILTPAARSIGAVNTLSLKNGQLTGDNTDWSGFLHDLNANFHLEETSTPRQAIVLGAGGSARAVVYALLQSGCQVNITSRRPQQAQQLAADFSTRDHTVTTSPLDQICGSSEIALIINTTPVGMSPNINIAPWPVALPFPGQAFVYDLIYNPTETALMKAARSAGLQSVNGLGMLIEQAALAFEIWTGRSVSREVFRRGAIERNQA
jgi:shikimate dehydrogenase